jgi:Ricin-type beta-trefoil lectin domain
MGVMSNTHLARRRKAGVFGSLFTVAALLGTVLFAAPAHADTIHAYWNGAVGNNSDLAPHSDSSGAYLFMGAGMFPWHVQAISNSPSGHARVYLKTASTGGRCLDDHAVASGGDPLAISCNGGDYQLWEVFYESDGSRVFKSWGAWTQQSRHLCLAFSSSGSNRVVMYTCNESSSRQQWYTF